MESQIIELGVATLPDETWEQARRRTEIIGPLAALEVLDTGPLTRQPLRWGFPGGRSMS